MSLLAIEELTVRHGAATVVDGVSLTVARGEIVALVGSSGSGKSTVALAVPGLLPAGAAIGGAIRIDGVQIAGLSETALADVRGRRVALVFQEPATALNPALSIGRQIGEVLARHGKLAAGAIDREVAALLDRVGLNVAPSRAPHMLSGGQRQRVAVAMAIAAGPALLIADEPTAALDPIAQQSVIALLVGLVRERSMGLLLISHDLALVAGIADRLVVLEAGRIAEQGPVATVLAQPRSAALRAMIAPLRGAPADRPPVAAQAILHVSQVSRAYGGGGRLRPMPPPAVESVTLLLRRGETLAIVGESGSGKSTLARLILGLERPDAGIVLVGGQPWLGASDPQMRAMRRQIQAVFQDPAASFDPRQTVGRIVAEPLHLLGRQSAAEQARQVAAVLQQVGLPAAAAERLPAQFSGGQRQRIAIARALILKPEIIVLDEALTALDTALRAEILALLLRLQAENGLAYLFISHDMRLVRGFADRVMVMNGGRVVEEGAVAAVLEQPRNPYTAALLAASPGLHGLPGLAGPVRGA